MTYIDQATLAEIKELASIARPLDDDEDSTDRQIDAENAFFERVEEVLPPDVMNKLSHYCLKATTDERIDEALHQVELLADDDEPGDRPACQILGGPHHRDDGRGVCIDCGEFLPSSDGDYWKA